MINFESQFKIPSCIGFLKDPLTIENILHKLTIQQQFQNTPDSLATILDMKNAL